MKGIKIIKKNKSELDNTINQNNIEEMHSLYKINS